MHNILKKISTFGYIPITKIDDIDDVGKIANTLIEANFPILEITFRNRNAPEAIRIITKDFSEILIGAGTVLNINQAKEAIDAGAKFIISPSLDSEIVKFCLDNKILTIPGINTPTELHNAIKLGIKVCKFFPAEASGGLNYLNSMSEPFDKEIKFIPTGGINRKNICEYLKNDRVLACGGSWIINAKILANKNFSKITENIEDLRSVLYG